MKRLILDEYIQENKARFTRARLRMNEGNKPVRRKRSAVEKAILLKLDRARWKQWLADGRIEIVGVRKYRLRLFTENER